MEADDQLSRGRESDIVVQKAAESVTGLSAISVAVSSGPEYMLLTGKARRAAMSPGAKQQELVFSRRPISSRSSRY